jgi:hypothetical protein
MAVAQSAKTVDAGTTWTVDQTTQLSNLTIGEKAKLSAPLGHSLTMTVNGVETAMKAGTYSGNIVLTVADDILVKYNDMGDTLKHLFRTAVYIDDGKYVASKSVPTAVVGGSVTDTEAKDLSLTSKSDKFNGIIVEGNSKYTIDNPVIDFTGNGGNDFVGFGAGIKSSGKADVTVNNAKVVTRGSIRTAIFVGGESTMHVNNSSIEVFNGPLPANKASGIRESPMDQVPWGLGLVGNIRATNLVDHGTAYYNHSHIKSQGWGALSIDDAQHVRLFVTDSTIETVESGYGAYSIGDSIDTFKHSTLKVASVGLIMASEGSGVFTDGTTVNSGLYGVMIHNAGGGHLTIEKGSSFHTKNAVIEVKSSGTNIDVDGAQLQADNGVILQAMVNDDIGPAGDASAVGPATGPNVPAGGGPGTMTSDGSPTVPPSGGPNVVSKKTYSKDIIANFKNVTLTGDFFNGRPNEGELTINFEKSTIQGAISTTTTKPENGVAPNSATRAMVGRVLNTIAATNDKYGLKLSLDGASKWTVSKTSYLTSLTIAKGGTITAPEGQNLAMTVNGKRVPVKAGSYNGKIVLEVSPKA